MKAWPFTILLVLVLLPASVRAQIEDMKDSVDKVLTPVHRAAASGGSVNDKAVSLAYAGSFDFRKGQDGGFYVYDSRGALVRDPDRGFCVLRSLSHGYPTDIMFDSGSMTRSVYTPDGERLLTEWCSSVPAMRRLAAETANANTAEADTASGIYRSSSAGYVYNTREYAGPFIIDDGVHTTFLFEGGYCTLGENGEETTENDSTSADSVRFHFYVTDRLGSVRVVVGEDGRIEQQNYYYARGGLIGDTYTAPDFQTRKYCGKELDRRFGLDLYDHGARRYDPLLVTWTSPDPLCEKYPWISPYAFSGSNPMRYLDPNGRAIFLVNGRQIGTDGINDDRVLLMRTKLMKRSAEKEMERYIVANSGNTNAFTNKDMDVYGSFVEIEPSAANRKEMVRIVMQDNGRGGTADENNCEYGGTIQNGIVIEAEHGQVNDPESNAYVTMTVPLGYSSFHSHPSRELGNFINPSTYSSPAYRQPPSEEDCNNSDEHFIHYVFARANNKVYVYNRQGELAVIPMEYFVTPQKPKE